MYSKTREYHGWGRYRKMTLNRQYRLARYPKGLPQADDWTLCEQPLGVPQGGELLVKVCYISIDPAMRGWLSPGKSYLPPVAIGEVMRAAGVGEVVISRHPAFEVGDLVSGLFGVQSYSIISGERAVIVDPGLGPLPKHLSVFGMTGLTAYFGLMRVGQPKPGDTVVVSSAAGAVGSIVGQIAKIVGCRVVGIAGGKRKCAYVTDELGFDACIDYRRGPIFTGLARYCPEGVDVYFDNVGGEILDAVLTRLRMNARIVICGAISQINSTSGAEGPRNYLSLLVNRARMEGFVVFDFEPEYAHAVVQLGQWAASGQLKSDEDIVEGMTAFPTTILKLFSGENFGKLMLHIDEHAG